jgi:hypothetical protein
VIIESTWSVGLLLGTAAAILERDRVGKGSMFERFDPWRTYEIFKGVGRKAAIYTVWSF